MIWRRITKMRINSDSDYHKVFDILEFNERGSWSNLITPYIKKIDPINRVSYIGNKERTFAFIPEELDINYPWKFKIGDIVTDGNDIMVISHLPEIHPENTDYVYQRVLINGNTYWVVKLDEDGNDKDTDDPVYYLHNYFNENQIWKVDEETSNFWKEKIKDKKLFCCLGLGAEYPVLFFFYLEPENLLLSKLFISIIALFIYVISQ